LRVVFAVLVVIHSPRALYKPDSFEGVVRACGLPDHGLCSLFRRGHIRPIGVIRIGTVRMPQSTNSAPPSGADFLHLEQELNWRRIHDSNRFQKSGMSSATVALSAVKRNTSPPFRLTLRPKLAWDVTWRQHPDKCKGVKPSAKKDLPWSGVSSISTARTLSPYYDIQQR